MCHGQITIFAGEIDPWQGHSVDLVPTKPMAPRPSGRRPAPRAPRSAYGRSRGSSGLTPVIEKDESLESVEEHENGLTSGQTLREPLGCSAKNWWVFMDFRRISASKDEQLRTGIKGVAGLFPGATQLGSGNKCCKGLDQVSGVYDLEIYWSRVNDRLVGLTSWLIIRHPSIFTPLWSGCEDMLMLSSSIFTVFFWNTKCETVCSCVFPMIVSICPLSGLYYVLLRASSHISTWHLPQDVFSFCRGQTSGNESHYSGYRVFPMFVVRSYLHVWWEYMGM